MVASKFSGSVLASAAGASIWVNGQVKENSGDWYDEIMNLVL